MIDALTLHMMAEAIGLPERAILDLRSGVLLDGSGSGVIGLIESADARVTFDHHVMGNTLRDRQATLVLSLPADPKAPPDRFRLLISWILWRIAAQDHGCIRRDCSHTQESECGGQLYQDFAADWASRVRREL